MLWLVRGHHGRFVIIVLVMEVVSLVVTVDRVVDQSVDFALILPLSFLPPQDVFDTFPNMIFLAHVLVSSRYKL